MSDNLKLADLLLPHIDKTPDYYEALYPERSLKEGAKVTRVAPSPTGYLHIGTLFTSLVNRIAATSSEGIFFTRIEDTDKKREVEGGIENIIDGLNRFGITIDEGFVSGKEEKGIYGPYQQSRRAEIYQTYVKDLIRKGFAYPCFCTAEELEATRAEQEKANIRTGYHGEWAACRSLTFDEIKSKIDAGIPFVIRLKSPGNEENKVVYEDLIKGKIEMPENDEDFVLLKSDGIPTYHFAHAIDDHLMHTTHVMRGDEWISSVPKHLQLFRILGFKVPKFAHVSPIMKLDDGAKRKISKRKDPEAAVHFFIEEGFDAIAVVEYLMTIAASDFEDFRRANPDKPYTEFKFNLKKMSVSGALFDENKLLDVSKNIISRMSGETVSEKITAWAKEFDTEFYRLLIKDQSYTKAIFSIDRDCAKPRKDIAKWKEAKDYVSYFFDELFAPDYTLPDNLTPADACEFLKAYVKVYNESDDKQQWFERIKELCPALGFASETKAYKAAPASYKGHAGDLSTVLRIAVTGRRNTPDLCSIMKVLGKDKCVERIEEAIKHIL
ncbi:MAG: glutamate--tRNA ligase [Clostridia bacterium]|nr:glutamate--tRNA ligase [Clostridia bacterium]